MSTQAYFTKRIDGLGGNSQPITSQPYIVTFKVGRQVRTAERYGTSQAQVIEVAERVLSESYGRQVTIISAVAA